MRRNRFLAIDVVSGAWRWGLHRQAESLGVWVVVIGRLRFWYQWPVPPIRGEGNAATI
jgi:hypothetical protein